MSLIVALSIGIAPLIGFSVIGYLLRPKDNYGP